MALTMVERPGRRQDQRRGAARCIGCSADRDAAVGLAERRSVVDPVAGHGDDVTEFLQALHDLVFVLGEHPAEAVGALDLAGDVGRDRRRARSVLEEIARDDEMVAHAELLGDLVADRDVVAGHHLDGEAELLGLGDGLLGVGARRIGQRDQAEQLPGLAVVGPRDAEGAVAVGCEVGDGPGVFGEGRRVGLRQRRDHLRRALGEMMGLARRRR